MTTQYTTILKLALPVQGELSGTWGDVVNDNITEMVEQAIAGKAVVNTWTGNSHTLTTADGTTSESRCAILELTDTGTALTGAGTVTCPTNTKLYIVDNNTAQIITVKTSGGTGVAVPVGKTMLVYCDGTNVVEGVTHANSLSLGTSTVTADKILDEDNMASDSATAIATQQSIKAYVDSQVGTVDTLAEILANGNTTGANDIDVDSAQKVQFRDAAIYINSSVDGQLDIVADSEVQIDTALVDINGNLDVSGTTNISGSTSFTKNAIAGVAISTTSRASNTVTVTNSAVHGLTNGDLVNINGVANRSFNGYFTVSVSSTTVFTYSQTGADESSTGGTSTEIVYNLNASGTALNQMNGPLNITANSGIDGLEITQSGSGEALSITGGNALFGDNDKAIFGIGNDLQIYHDGSHSYIKDAGDGQLRLLAGTNVQIWNSDATSLAANFNGDTQTSLYYAGAVKLATTTTGIDVTGTVTADGLTVDGPASFDTNDAANPVVISRFGSTNESLSISVNDSMTSFVSEQDETDTTRYGGFEFIGRHAGTNRTRLKIDHTTGDISFYEDTGTTPKLFWDASAESLGIGNAIPIAALDVTGTDAVGNLTSLADTVTRAAAIIRGSTHTNGYGLYMGYGNSSTDAQYIQSTLKTGSQSYPLLLNPYGGNVGIGTGSPTRALHVNSGSSNEVARFESTDTEALIELVDTTGSAQIRSRNDLRFYTNGGSTRAMDIDSSGNLLVGKTNTSFETEGFVYEAGAAVEVTTDSNRVMRLNRTTNDGNILEFNKDGTTLGSIGVKDGDLVIHSTAAGHEGLRLGNGAIVATDNAGATTDAACNLGGATSRFTNLYLSGGTIVAGRTTFGTAGFWDASGTGNDKGVRVGGAGLYPTDGSGTATDATMDIGTAAARFKDLYLSNNISLSNASTSAFLQVSSNVLQFGTSSSDPVVFYAGNAEAARLDASGNLLVGLSSGQDALIHAQAPKTTYTDYATVFAGGLDSHNGDHAISLMTAGNGLAGIIGSNLSIDGSTFSQPETARSSGYISFSNPTTAGKTSIITFGGLTKGTATALPKMTLDGDGNLLVGRTSTFTFSTNTTDGIVLSPSRIDVSSAALCRISQVRNSVGTYDRFYNNAAIVGSISGTTTATAYNTSSDQRLKDNIVDAPSASNDIDAIQVRSFDWKADGSHQKYGMVAQELQTVAPEAVSAPEDPEEMMGVDYSKLVPMMLKEIQSLRARIAALES